MIMIQNVIQNAADLSIEHPVVLAPARHFHAGGRGQALYGLWESQVFGLNHEADSIAVLPAADIVRDLEIALKGMADTGQPTLAHCFAG